MSGDIILPLTEYHWLVLGLALLIVEALGAAGFMLGAAAAAFAVAVLMLVFDIGWQWQLGLFAVLAVVFTAVYWRKFRRFNRRRADHDMLNQRAAQLIGRRVKLEEPLHGGQGKIRIGDTLWSVTADAADIDAETTIEVVGCEGMTLSIRPVGD